MKRKRWGDLARQMIKSRRKKKETGGYGVDWKIGKTF